LRHPEEGNPERDFHERLMKQARKRAKQDRKL